MNQDRVAILDGCRTPFSRAGGKLRDLSAQDLGSLALRELLQRTETQPSAIDECIFGNVAQPMDATNVSRVIALRSGLPQDISAFTVARNCASGMQSMASAIDLIRTQRADLVVAGGTESMSNIPLVFSKRTTRLFESLFRAKSPLDKLKILARFRPRHFKPVIALMEGLTDPFCGLNMGQTAEVLAKELNIGRDEQDEFALRSHQRAIQAQEDGFFEDEVIPVFEPELRDPLLADHGPRAEQTLEQLAKLRPFFDRHHGSVTVGNSCPITDGAAAMLLASEAYVEAKGITPLAWIKDYAFAGVDPKRMGLGPVAATATLLDRTELHLNDIDFVELNEAFSAQVLACLKCFSDEKTAESYGFSAAKFGDLSLERLNVHGGAIALGHPVGTSGTRIALTLARTLQRNHAERGIATMCIGGGQGGAIFLERGK